MATPQGVVSYAKYHKLLLCFVIFFFKSNIVFKLAVNVLPASILCHFEMNHWEEVLLVKDAYWLGVFLNFNIIEFLVTGTLPSY